MIKVFRCSSIECKELKDKNKKAQAWAQVAKEMEMTSLKISETPNFSFPHFCSRFRFLHHKSREDNNTQYQRVSAAMFAERTDPSYYWHK